MEEPIISNGLLHPILMANICVNSVERGAVPYLNFNCKCTSVTMNETIHSTSTFLREITKVEIYIGFKINNK